MSNQINGTSAAQSGGTVLAYAIDGGKTAAEKSGLGAAPKPEASAQTPTSVASDRVDPSARPSWADKLRPQQSATTEQRNAISEALGRQGVYIGTSPNDAQIRNGTAKAASLVMRKDGDLGAFLKEVASKAPGHTFGSDLLKSANAVGKAGASGLSPAAEKYSAGLIVSAFTGVPKPESTNLSESELKAANSFGKKFIDHAATHGWIPPEMASMRSEIVARLEKVTGGANKTIDFFRNLTIGAPGEALKKSSN